MEQFFSLSDFSEMISSWQKTMEEKQEIIQKFAIKCFNLEQQIKWISVEEKLPSEYLEEVLAFLVTKEVCLCCYNTISKMWTYNCTCNIHEDNCDCRIWWPEKDRDVKHKVNVSHWMPLPNPPEEKL